MTKIIEANGGEYEYEYDKIGNLVKIIDPMENVRMMSYNSLNKLIEVIDAMGYTTVYQYDPEGMLTRIVDANGYTKEYQYDALDRLILEIDLLGNETRYGYDPVGNLAFKIDAEGRRTSYTYDPLDRLIQIEYQTGEKEKFEYDPLGRIIRAESPEFVQTFSYDKLGRKVKARNETLGTEIQYSYDAVGNLKTLTTPKGSVISYEYDALNRLVKANLPTNHYAEYEYDANNNLTRMKYSNGVVTEYSYDEMNQIKSIVTHGPYGVLSSFTYERDLVGNILKCTEEDGAVTLYRYDANYRLTKVIYPVEKITAIRDVQLITQPIGGNEKEKGKGKNQKDNDNQPDPAENFDYLALPFNVVTYEYDAVGNMIRKNQDGVETLYQYNAANQLIQAGDVRYIYDRLGNRIQKISPEGTVTYKYDYANRLSQVLFDDGTEVRYGYDALGRRVKREESYWHTSNQLRWEKTVYVYDGNRLLAEYDQHGGGIQPLAEYFSGNGNIIARKMYGYHDRKLKGYQPNTRGFLFFYHHDVNRNVMDITDRSGNSLFKYRYGAFGEVYAGVMEPYNHHGLTEKFYDTKVKLYHFKARDYDPVTGQWIQRDRYRGRLSDPRTLHGYMYAYQNPVRFEDPLGYDVPLANENFLDPQAPIPQNPEPSYLDEEFDKMLNNLEGKILRKGDRGEDVKDLQTVLNQGFGYTLSVDGIYGQKTEAAVKEVQTELAVTVDGIFGSETLGAIKEKLGLEPKRNTGVNITDVIKGVQGDPRVIEAQAYLSLMGFPIGTSGPNRNGVDGKVGPKSKGAIKAFQKMIGIEPSGEFNDTTISAMKRTVGSNLTIRDLAKDAYQKGVEFEISSKSSKADFVNAVYYYAILDEENTGVPAAVTTAQAILESNYGRAVPIDMDNDQYSYNLFGIKGEGTAGSVIIWTHEEERGIKVKVKDKFRAYNNFGESINDHSMFLVRNSRYESLFESNDPKEWAKGLQEAGYATDSDYADKLISVIKSWGLK
ncbi:hypothetical protein BBF96_12215 [Anoxybacter fermentans]|uniref:Mannosyl-glycoprotein endo-beta-N-acetylglucosamidase-like domain-containing protein n=1 Tax=Anoxybacter fermentans TaxID=1323375 RepID=A0A3S9T0G6_9FIRM|nr:hypothetical protein BBF96_12215 [Anoxybacter fermentans]